MIVLAALALTATGPAPSHRADIERAFDAVQAGRPQAALDTIEPVIAIFEAEHRQLKQQVYCGSSGAETLAYMAIAAGQKKSAIAVSPDWCEALFLKGYALIDLGRVADARASFRYLLTFAPYHAHFHTELGQSFRHDRDWPSMLASCTTAVGYADLADSKAEVTKEKTAAWRCMGYALVEQGKWDEAAALYRKCLALDPNDPKAKGELQYIAEQRPKPAS